MTAAQRERLETLLPEMKQAARRKVTQNAYHRAFAQCRALQDFIHGQPSQLSAEEWLAYAKSETKKETA